MPSASGSNRSQRTSLHAYLSDVIRGRNCGPGSLLVRALLRVASFAYAPVVGIRNRWYDHCRCTQATAAIPVISVGNLTAGGTGKTPMIAWLAGRLGRVQPPIRVAILSRGYRAPAGGPNDEALELAAALPHVPHVQNPDRVAGVRAAIQQHASQLILLDDGFQHRRLARDLDIVLLDALDPFGGGHLLPRGLLREPPAGLCRADVVGLSRSDLVSGEARAAIRQRVAAWAPQALWLELAHGPQCLESTSQAPCPVAALAQQNVVAFCGIGNPDAFRRTLEQLGYQLVGFREFPDHHAYGRAELDELAEWAESCGAAAVVCTVKDLVKIRLGTLGSVPLWSLRVSMVVREGQTELDRLLEQLVQRVRRDKIA